MPRGNDDFSAEIQAHIDLEADRLIAEGIPADQARTRARRAFGNVTTAQERFYESRRILWLDDLLRDARYAVRTLARSRGFTVTAVLTLALGVGAVTAIFSVVNAILIRPLPFDRPDGLYRISKITPEGVELGLSMPEFNAWREDNRTFDQLAAYTVVDFNIRGDRPESVLAVWASSNFLELLGVTPLLGRSFTAQEFRPGAGPVVLVSHDLWQRRFGAAPDIVGRTIDLEGPSFLSESSGRYTIAGVLPADFWLFFVQTDLIIPNRASATQAADPAQRLVNTVLGRLTGATPEQARSDIAAIAGRAELPDSPTSSIAMVGVRDWHFGDVQRPLVLLMGSAVLVCLVACANLTLLLGTRNRTRVRELGLRFALGASRGRIVRQWLTESITVSLAGGAAGLLLASAGIRLLSLVLPSPIVSRVPGGTQAFSLDARVLVLAAVATLVVGAYPPPWMYFTVEGADASFETVQRAIWAVGADQPVDGPWTLQQWVSQRTAQPRLLAWLGNAFAGVTLTLAMIGLYGVLAFGVARRTHEIGVRMALGARRSEIRRLVLSQSIAPTGMGIVLGLAAAATTTRYLESMLFGVTPLDPTTFIVVPLLFLVVALLASYIPARRATNVDPLVALRYE